MPPRNVGGTWAGVCATGVCAGGSAAVGALPSCCAASDAARRPTTRMTAARMRCCMNPASVRDDRIAVVTVPTETPAPLSTLREDERLFQTSVYQFADAEIRPHVREMDE